MNAALKIVKGSLDSGKKDYINHASQTEPRTGVFFKEFIEKTVSRKAKRMGESYTRNYKTLLFHINAFSETFDVNIYTNSVNEEFLDDFIVYLQEKGLKNGYIKMLLSLTKAMVKKAAMYGYAIDPSYDDVDLDDETSFSIHLTMNEITRIYYFQGLTKKQSRVRDLFVVGCLTGLRYSDYSTLTRFNFQGDYIEKVTKKTGKKVTIPLHDYVKEIYERYEGEISSGLTIQHFNRYIKLICEKIGLTEPVTFNYTKGGELVNETKPKFELVSSHTARRSFATNAYMTGRMQPFEIMAITGHTTEKSFFRYIKITRESLAKKISTDNFFRK